MRKALLTLSTTALLLCGCGQTFNSRNTDGADAAQEGNESVYDGSPGSDAKPGVDAPSSPDALSDLDAPSGHDAPTSPDASTDLDATAGPDTAIADGTTAEGSAEPDGGADTAAHDAGSDVTTGSDGASDAGVDAAPEAGSDAGSDSGIDAGADAGAPGCGGTFCRGSQTCVANQCVYTGCTGVNVPGDYATVQGAANALAATGGTICLGARAYGENVTIPFPSASRSYVTIQGVSASSTSLDQLSTSSAPSAGLVVKGLTIGSAGLGGAYIEGCAFPNGLNLSGGGIILEPTQLVASAVQNGLGIEGAVSIDQSDISGGISFDCWYEQPPPSVIQNSYIHGGTYGLNTVCPSMPDGNHIVLLNDTLLNNTSYGIGPWTPNYGVTILGINNVIVGSAIAFGRGVFSNTAVFDDTTLYASGVGPEIGNITGDPELDTSTPPVPLTGSSCLGTGVASATLSAQALTAPSYDYWGRPRDSSRIDVGAIQVSP
jgi:hypothetical protein